MLLDVVAFLLLLRCCCCRFFFCVLHTSLPLDIIIAVVVFLLFNQFHFEAVSQLHSSRNIFACKVQLNNMHWHIKFVPFVFNKLKCPYITTH